jgi:cytochrome c
MYSRHEEGTGLMKLPVVIAIMSVAATAASADPLPKPAAFAMCGVCHKVEAGASPAIGPNLWGVGGRVSGTLPGYTYSPAMKAAKIKWTKSELMSYVANPQAKVPGTKMTYAGEKDPAKQAAIVDYLLSLK